MHETFHVSQLKKCVRAPTEVILEFEGLTIAKDLSYQEAPLHILEGAERRTRNETIMFVKVQWKNHIDDEATWEREDQMRTDHPALFA